MSSSCCSANSNSHYLSKDISPLSQEDQVTCPGSSKGLWWSRELNIDPFSPTLMSGEIMCLQQDVLSYQDRHYKAAFESSGGACRLSWMQLCYCVCVQMALPCVWRHCRHHRAVRCLLSAAGSSAGRVGVQ